MSRTVDELDQALRAAKDRVARAVRALKPKLTLEPEGPEMDECRAAFAEQLALEREVALTKGEEAALLIEWRPQWDTGAPLPYVLASGSRTFLVYRIREPDPAWDGTYANLVDPASEDSEPLAIVEFRRCYAHRFGGSNDEVLEGHPLYGKGLEAYRAHEVKNSSWLAAEQAINSVHSGYRPEYWTKWKHYLLAFHDQYFECLAERYEIELVRSSFRDAVARMAGRLFEKSPADAIGTP